MELAGPWPDVIVAVGHYFVEVAVALKRQSGGAIKVVMLGKPPTRWKRLNDFVFGRGETADLAIIPGPFLAPNTSSSLCVDLPFSLVDADALSAAERQFSMLASLPKPRIAVLVGGVTKRMQWTPDIAKKLGSEVNTLAKNLGGSLMVTTSFRTGVTCSNALLAAIDVPHAAYVWGQSAEPNPFMGYLAFADGIVVTMDSVAMAADAVKSGKPVVIYKLPQKDLAWLKSIFERLLYLSGRDQLFDRLVKAGALNWFNPSQLPAGKNKNYIDTSEVAIQAVRALVR
jgi:mitochondrial fission protein ELM1